jgi:site-specific DNA recombinase
MEASMKTQTTQNLKPCFLYRRVSSSQQVQFGESLGSQLERLEAYAKNGYQVMGSYCDSGISGKSISGRPELQKCLDAACKVKGSTIITYSISRISRSVKDMAVINERLGKAGVQLVSLSENIDTSTAAGKLTFQLFISLAEHERNLLSERVSGVLRTMRAAGKVTGNTPFGYTLAKDKKTLVYCAEQFAVIKTMKALRNKGLTFRAIATELMARGMKPQRAKSWSAGGILRILRNQTERQVAA